MKFFFKRVIISISILIFVFFIILAVYKEVVYAFAYKKGVLWNDNRTCYIETFRPDYYLYGVPGRVLQLISSQSFFVVYDKNGKELKNSSRYFWESQFSDLEEAKWNKNVALYPTVDGWSGWRLPECK